MPKRLTAKTAWNRAQFAVQMAALAIIAYHIPFSDPVVKWAGVAFIAFGDSLWRLSGRIAERVTRVVYDRKEHR